MVQSLCVKVSGVCLQWLYFPTGNLGLLGLFVEKAMQTTGGEASLSGQLEHTVQQTLKKLKNKQTPILVNQMLYLMHF